LTFVLQEGLCSLLIHFWRTTVSKTKTPVKPVFLFVIYNMMRKFG